MKVRCITEIDRAHSFTPLRSSSGHHGLSEVQNIMRRLLKVPNPNSTIE